MKYSVWSQESEHSTEKGELEHNKEQIWTGSERNPSQLRNVVPLASVKNMTYCTHNPLQWSTQAKRQHSGRVPNSNVNKILLFHVHIYTGF